MLNQNLGMVHSAMKNAPTGRAYSSRGITLVEIMVTVFLVGIGMLGVAGLQATSIRAGHMSVQRTLAVFHVADIFERIQANRDGLASYSYSTNQSALDNITDCFASSTCSAQQMALYDVKDWKGLVEESFGEQLDKSNGISITVTGDNVVAVTIRWSERGDKMTYKAKVQV